MLRMKGARDLQREVFKSATCRVLIPEIEFETSAESGTSVMSSVEGLIETFYDNLSVYFTSDGKVSGEATAFLNRLKGIMRGDELVTIIMEDTSGRSYIQGFEDDGEGDLEEQEL